jgi:hypothetical protein
MKNIAILVSILLLFGCSKDNDSKQPNGILLLKVDYMTSVFEGGKELSISTKISSSDTIPISVDYRPPGDFGSIALYYQPTNDMIFSGTIIWVGTGQISYPSEFDSPDKFSKLGYNIEQPDITRYQTIYYSLSNQPIEYTNIWNAISNLEIVNDYLSGGKRIGLFLYTPSVGVGDPNEWDWFVILNK